MAGRPRCAERSLPAHRGGGRTKNALAAGKRSLHRELGVEPPSELPGLTRRKALQAFVERSEVPRQERRTAAVAVDQAILTPSTRGPAISTSVFGVRL